MLWNVLLSVICTFSSLTPFRSPLRVISSERTSLTTFYEITLPLTWPPSSLSLTSEHTICLFVCLLPFTRTPWCNRVCLFCSLLYLECPEQGLFMGGAHIFGELIYRKAHFAGQICPQEGPFLKDLGITVVVVSDHFQGPTSGGLELAKIDNVSSGVCYPARVLGLIYLRVSWQFSSSISSPVKWTSLPL